MLYILDNVLTSDDIEYLLKDWTADNFTDNSFNHKDPVRKKSASFNYDHPGHTDKCHYFWQKLQPRMNTYLVQKLSQPYFVWYRETDYYQWHLDSFPCAGVPSHYSFTCFLNDPDEYEGGELVLQLGPKEISIKEPKGTCVLYYTGLRHKVNEVRSGDRKVVVGWGESFVANSKVRETLTELQLFLNDMEDSIAVEEYERLDTIRLNLMREYANL